MSASLGNIIVAADHSDRSLQRYAGSMLSQELTLIRRAIVRASIEAGADGVVVSPGDASWFQDQNLAAKIVIGLPDTVGAESAITLYDRLKSLNIESNGIVKFGFSVKKDNLQSSLKNILLYQNVFAHLQLIAEPYFDSELDVDARMEFIRAVAKQFNITAFKLDVYDPATYSLAYSEAAGLVPWYARSDGMQYEMFLRAFKLEHFLIFLNRNGIPDAGGI